MRLNDQYELDGAWCLNNNPIMFADDLDLDRIWEAVYGYLIRFSLALGFWVLVYLKRVVIDKISGRRLGYLSSFFFYACILV